jgi:hypothetical protein
MKIQNGLTESTLKKHGVTPHPNEHRGLSTPEEKELALAAIAEQQKKNAPKPQTIDPWGGPCTWRGVKLPCPESASH